MTRWKVVDTPTYDPAVIYEAGRDAQGPVIRILQSKDAGRLLARKEARFTEAEEAVRPILDAIRKRGDRALSSMRTDSTACRGVRKECRRRS
jgi:hypothetical protein